LKPISRRGRALFETGIYRKDPWLNAPTHPDYDANSMFDVFELSTIATLDEKIRESKIPECKTSVRLTVPKKIPFAARKQTSCSEGSNTRRSRAAVKLPERV
jgi:hypothetical protein